MSGLMGTTAGSYNSPERIIAQGLELHTQSSKQVSDPVFSDRHLAAGRLHLGVIGEASSPTEVDGVLCWVLGEAYGEPDVALGPDTRGRSLAEMLALGLRAGTLDALLHGLDGFFAAVLYDRKARRVHLVTDRYGLKLLYVWDRPGAISWASELKGFFAFPDFSKQVRPEAVASMLKLDFLLGSLTWFENVRPLPAASVLTYDAASGQLLRQRRYWTWAEIVPQQVALDEAIEQLGDLIEQAVRRRVAGPGRLGLSLSGGLDSRALLAALPDPADEVHTFTYGQRHSEEIRLARRCARMRGTPHVAWRMTRENWLDGRGQAVWQTDGMLNLLHMHYSPFFDRVASRCDVNLNGFLADGFLGTKWIKNEPQDRRPDVRDADRLFGELAHFVNPDDPFYACEHLEPFFIDTKGRRFVNMGTVQLSPYLESRKPFLDNEIVEFVFSLPDDYRVSGKLYERALVRKFPRYFVGIPWETTGLPIEGELSRRDQRYFRAREAFAEKHGLSERDWAVANYRDWLVSEPTYSQLTRLLDPDTALYREFVEHDYANNLRVEASGRGRRSYLKHITRVVTVELWLRQLAGVPIDGLKLG